MRLRGDEEPTQDWRGSAGQCIIMLESIQRQGPGSGRGLTTRLSGDWLKEQPQSPDEEGRCCRSGWGNEMQRFNRIYQLVSRNPVTCLFLLFFPEVNNQSAVLKITLVTVTLPAEETDDISVSARDKMGSVSPSHQGPLSQHKAYLEDALEPFYHSA